MTKTLNWRLSKLPTVEELRELVKDKIITQEEARQILFNLEEKDIRALESEIKFLKELVDKLSNHNNYQVVKIIKEVEKPIYCQQPWYKLYDVYCGSVTNGTASISNANATSVSNLRLSNFTTDNFGNKL